MLKEHMFPIFVRQGKSKSRFKVGYINESGALAIDPIFNEGTFFADGMAAVQVDGGKWGIIDAQGNFLIPPTLWNWCRFQDGLAPLATKEGKWGVIDRVGAFVVPPVYDYLGPFDCGLSLARVGEGARACFGFINRNGVEEISLRFEKAKKFSEGLAAVRLDSFWGYILASGDFQITPRFDGRGSAKRWPDTRAGEFADGLAPVWVGGDHYRFIDTSGSYAFENEFDDANSFSEDLAVVKQGNRFGYIHKNGQIAIECKFALARDFSEGLAKVEEEESGSGLRRATGFINREGKMVIAPKFRKADCFRAGLCLVATEDLIGYINNSGEFVWEGPYVDYGVLF
jgi:hypothetical protein